MRARSLRRAAKRGGVLAMMIGAMSAMGLTVPRGEPYRMMGKRLAFTNWHFIRPGGVGWKDAEGKPVYATKDFAYAPDACTWNCSPSSLSEHPVRLNADLSRTELGRVWDRL